MSGDNLTGILNQQKRLQKIEVRGNSYLRAMDPGHAGEVHSVDMDLFFDGDQRLQQAVAMRDVRAQSLDADSEMQLSGANNARNEFSSRGRSRPLERNARQRPVSRHAFGAEITRGRSTRFK